MIATGGRWHPTLRSASDLVVPIAVGVAVAFFVLVQALVDRRDPKLSSAPQRGREDTVGFQ